MRQWIVLALTGLCGFAAHGAPDSPPETALADYVAEPDASFAWRLQARHEVDGSEIAQLFLQSQTWRGTVWKHQLFLIRPAALDTDRRQGLLVIGGGRWRDSYEKETLESLPDESGVFVEMANRLGTIVAVVGQVPFQPLFGLNEDHLIAHTFDEYLADGDAEWPLLLPMVKSAVRAMDAAQAFSAEEWRVELRNFTVIGGSKRGWTTWLTGAVEPRAATLVPLVIDALNLGAHMSYQTAAWGAPSDELAPYAERGLVEVLASDEGAELRSIVDPYSYREQLTQPKLIVVATNDAYFPLDAMNLYWNDLPGPKYALYLPNQGHSTDDFGRLIPALNAAHRGALPRLEWEFENDEARLRLCVRAEPAPASVIAWVAESADRDFRDATFVSRPTALQRDVFVIDFAPPSSGYKSVFAEALFGSSIEESFSLSTNVRISDSLGRPASDATAIDGTEGICP